MLKEIADAASEATNYSTFFVCILSHGIEGHVYGVNSLPVRVDKIYDSMQKKVGQPKVLILQSCQGTACQEGCFILNKQLHYFTQLFSYSASFY